MEVLKQRTVILKIKETAEDMNKSKLTEFITHRAYSHREENKETSNNIVTKFILMEDRSSEKHEQYISPALLTATRNKMF